MLHLDGEINGKVISSNSVIIGKSGVLKGDVEVDKMIVNGLFEGEIKANHLEILAGGVVNANIVVCEISIEIGAKFNGHSTVVEKHEISEPAKLVEEK